MATYAETKIWDALAARLATLVLTPAAPVQWPRMAFNKPNGTYLKVDHLPGATSTQSRIDVTGSNQHVGLLQVSVFVPDKPEGESPVKEIVGAVISHFKRGTTMYREGIRVRVEAPPYAVDPLREKDWLQVPVTIPYIAFIPNL